MACRSTIADEAIARLAGTQWRRRRTGRIVARLEQAELDAAMISRAQFASPTGRVLMALIVGVAIGVGVAVSHDAQLLRLALSIEPIGVLWVNAIRMTVIPLVVS